MQPGTFLLPDIGLMASRVMHLYCHSVGGEWFSYCCFNPLQVDVRCSLPLSSDEQCG